jgi:farnesyl diphosphate synthase
LVSLEHTLSEFQSRVEAALARWLPHDTIHPRRLHEAMSYATLGTGKRFRPCLVYATGQAIGVPLALLDGPACAVELIHAYSLVHDDLPAMDDDDLRRGRPTCHKAFDEATAILVGDALQSLAFYVLAHDPDMIDAAAARVKMIETLALASGSRGMAGGQALDMLAEGRELSVSELENVHIHKTGALIRASVRLATLCAPQLDERVRAGLDHYAGCVGLAFQIQDDVLDVEGSTDVLGKKQGADQSRAKSTYPALLGLAQAKAHARELHDQAIESLRALGESADLLRALAGFVVERIR